ncbi:hypothetical protein GF371_02550 [Candidatus Woesearchaeota archaeon]|nr:hypothetical protein [Candidatus Woesearchaeota archaeon]
MIKIELDAEFKLSKPLPAEAKQEIGSLLEKANKELFKKGSKEESEASHLREFKLNKDVLFLRLKSGGQVRAHDAVLRLRKPLAEVIGKKYKCGIKSTTIKNIKVEVKLEEKPEKEISLPFVEKINIIDDKAVLFLAELKDLELERNYLTKIINRFLSKISAQKVHGKAETEKTVRKSEKRTDKYAFKKDPTQELIDRGWVREFPGAGVWTLMPPFTALLKAIQQLLIDQVLIPMGFTEVILPRLIPLEIQRKKGQLGGIPEELFWVCPPAKRDPEYFEDYKDYVEITGECAPEKLMKKLRPPMFGLAYAQCEAFYDFFSKETIDASKLPFKFYDINGPTWRWEAGGLKGLERLNEFLRIEVVYAGLKDQVIKIRDEVLEKSEEIIDRIFDVEYRIDSCTPVYLEHAGAVEEEKDAEKEKEADFVKTYDMTAVIPFKTASKYETELEISSFHVHTDFYMKRFHAKEKNKKEVWTGCVGFGPSRWAYLFILRHGLDYSKWPAQIKKYIGDELPGVPDMVTWPKKKEEK